MTFAVGMNEDLLRTDIEINVTFFIVLSVANLTMATHIISKVTVIVTLILDNYCSVRVWLCPQRKLFI